MRCTCGRVKVGNTVTDERNWYPDCDAHGTKSEWYKSDSQVARRKATNDRVADLQRQAREARESRR